MNLGKFVLASCVAALAFVAPAHAAPVIASSQTVVNLGSFGPGSYAITGTGVVDLAGGGGSFSVGPDGVPVTPITSPGYGYCNPLGCTTDVFSGNAAGPGGASINLGALMGTLTATPTVPSDFFLIGFGTTVTLATAGNIYAQVNDTFYPNNVGSFDVNVAAVPEPASWAMMIFGFGAIGTMVRRRARVRVAFA